MWVNKRSEAAYVWMCEAVDERLAFCATFCPCWYSVFVYLVVPDHAQHRDISQFLKFIMGRWRPGAGAAVDVDGGFYRVVSVGI